MVTLTVFSILAASPSLPAAAAADAPWATPSSDVAAPAADLPDGRAYEQSTPSGKNGNNIQGHASLVQAASSGAAITSVVLGGIPGGEGAQEYPYFLSTRADEGWSTQGLLPKASSGFFGVVRGWDEELTGSFDTNRTETAEPLQTYFRSADGGGLTFVASGLSEQQFVGSTPRGDVAVFESPAELDPGAAEFSSNVYVWDRATGGLSVASVENGGEPLSSEGSFAGPYDWFNGEGFAGGARSGYYTQAEHALSVDGRSLYITAGGADPQVYLRIDPTAPQSALGPGGECTESAAGCTYMVSESERTVPDPEGEKPAAFMGAAENGSAALFLSSGKLTDDATTGPTDEGSDLYRYEVGAQPGERLTDLTPDSEPGDPSGAEVRGVLGTSADGSYVYFAANGVLAAGATHGDCGPGRSGVLSVGACNLYVWHGGKTQFIASLSTSATVEKSDGVDWAPTISVENGTPVPSTARVSADGAVVLFRSSSKLTAYENAGSPEFYRYEFGNPAIDCISCDPGGAPPSGQPTLQSIDTAEQGVEAPVALLTRNLSADGSRAFFESASALVAGDINDVTDVYEWEADGFGSCHGSAEDGGCLYLISTGTSPDSSYFADADSEGENVFFFTSQQLVGQDRDELVDIYDARVGGGIASQNPQLASPCTGEAACRPPTAEPPAPVAPASSGFVGPVNPKPPKSCRKGSHRKHGRCVRKSLHKKRSKARHRHREQGKRPASAAEHDTHRKTVRGGRA